ncbi:MAG: recombinase RecA [Actinomycetota bacterium]|nr:recombinase RecA [Actinomycetota bacterium]
MERDKALDLALGQIEKQFGKGSIMRMGENTHMQIEAVSTGALSLDLALGIGGLPRGRIVEIYGPESSGKSTLAMHAVAEAQRNGGICAYIDAEHAMDPVYAKAIGVNIDDLLISQPDTGEQALEITDMLIRSGALDIVVIDSVAALTPRAEIEGDMGDTHVGLQARLMSQALRKLTATLSKSNTIAIFINQLREKVGVIYGCFSYNTRVTLADGRPELIGKIVNQKLPVEVLSYDHKTGQIVPRRVVNWFDNGKTDEFLRFTVAKPGGNGRAQFSATRNHLIRTPGGWREAGSLSEGDRVLQLAKVLLSEFQMEVIRGALMGDTGLSRASNGIASRARWCHGPAQVEYGQWKADLFANAGTSVSAHSGGGIEVSTTPLAELSVLHDDVYVGAAGKRGAKRFSADFLKTVGPLGLAIWYQDDFGFSVRSLGKQTRSGEITGSADVCVDAMDPETQERVVEWLRDSWDLPCTLVTRARPVPEASDRALKSRCIVLTTEATARLHALIAPFVHPSMAHKLLPRYRGRFGVEAVFAPLHRTLLPMPIIKIEAKPPNGRHTHRFDIEVEGSHNYFVDGVMVHNSPEVTPGGRALKFYSSVRLDIRRVESIKDGAEVIGNRTRVKVAKNKCAAPFKTAEFDIMYGKGISREGSMLDVAVDLAIVKKSGAWYTYEGEQLGQGRENAKSFMAENLELMIEISEKVRQKVGIGVDAIDVPLGQGVGDDDPIVIGD